MAGERKSAFPSFDETISAITASQRQPLLFPSVTNHGNNVQEQSSSTKGIIIYVTTFDKI